MGGRVEGEKGGAEEGEEKKKKGSSLRVYEHLAP